MVESRLKQKLSTRAHALPCECVFYTNWMVCGQKKGWKIHAQWLCRYGIAVVLFWWHPKAGSKPMLCKYILFFCSFLCVFFFLFCKQLWQITYLLILFAFFFFANTYALTDIHVDVSLCVRPFFNWRVGGVNGCKTTTTTTPTKCNFNLINAKSARNCGLCLAHHIKHRHANNNNTTNVSTGVMMTQTTMHAIAFDIFFLLRKRLHHLQQQQQHLIRALTHTTYRIHQNNGIARYGHHIKTP